MFQKTKMYFQTSKMLKSVEKKGLLIPKGKSIIAVLAII